MTLLLLCSLIAHAEPDDAEDKADWDISVPHGAVHKADISVSEGTWMSVSLHGDTVVFDLLGDLWSIPVTGGDAEQLTSGAAWDSEPRFSPDGKWIAYASDAGGNEQIWVMRADGSEARQVTDEDEARVTDPVWDPAGDWLIVRRRTVDTRSIGVTELWQVHLDGGKGFQLTSLDDHPHAGETTVGEGRFVYFSTRHGRFSYDQDPVAGLWSIARLDRRTGDIRTVATGPGSAVRPTLSPDGNTLAIVTRDRTKTLLELLDLQSGERRVLADWLDHDQMEGFALHGVYPSMAWQGDDALILWAQGKLWRAGLDGSRAEIPFQAAGSWDFADVTRWPGEVPDRVQAKVLRWPVWNADGRLAFSAMGALWLRETDGTIERHSEGTGYAPAWDADGERLLWTSWSDTDGGSLHLTDKKGRIDTLPIRGQLVNPTFLPDGERIVVLRGVGGTVNPDLSAEPWYEIVLLTPDKKGWRSEVVTGTDARGSMGRAPRMFFQGDRIWFVEDRAGEPRTPTKTVLVSVKLDGTDKRTHLVFDGAQEVVPSPDFSRVAYKQAHQVHVAAMPIWGGGEINAGDLPGYAITAVGGDWLSWDPDGRTLSWAEGPDLRRLPVDSLKLAEPEEDAEEEPGKPGDDAETVSIDLSLPRHVPESTLALTNARVISMKGDEVLDNATLVIEGDRITSLTGPVPAGAEVIDLSGKTVIPGLVDVHAHLHYTAGDVLPEQEWRYQVNLDFGVTTVQDPSAATDTVFTQAERVEAGLMKGPRVYSTGFVLYGALSNQGAETPDEEAALHHVQRLKRLGARSVKVYQQSRRDQRQWYIQACNAEQMLCVPEGGGDLFMNLGMMNDGFHAIEHALPNAPLYEDVRSYFAATSGGEGDGYGTFYSPTLLVAYGGMSGENWFYQHMNPVDDERLRKHWPARTLDRVAWRRNMVAHDTDWNHMQVARDASQLADRGVKVTLGAHGQLQGLGAHWELWALAGPGAMAPHRALQSATIDGARYIGMDALIGSVEPGKFADLVILNSDPLADIRNSADIDFVIKNGEVWK